MIDRNDVRLWFQCMLTILIAWGIGMLAAVMQSPVLLGVAFVLFAAVLVIGARKAHQAYQDLKRINNW